MIDNPVPGFGLQPAVMSPCVLPLPLVCLCAFAHHDLEEVLAVQQACDGAGFVESAEVFACHLASYGAGAVYMARAMAD